MAAEEEVDLDMDEVKEEDLDKEYAEVEEEVKAYVVDVVVVVEAVGEELITIVTKTMEGIITIMDLIHQILRETLTPE